MQLISMQTADNGDTREVTFVYVCLVIQCGDQLIFKVFKDMIKQRGKQCDNPLT